MQSTKERLLGAVARYAKGKKGRLSGIDFCRKAGISENSMCKHFDGGFRALLAAAGLAHRVHHRKRIPEDELLAEFHRLAMRFKRYPKWQEINREGKFTMTAYFRRFGRARRLHSRYEQWRRQNPSRGLPPRALEPRRRSSPPAGEFPVGAPLSFRGLLHAPTTEAGVIHLFGLLGPDLGYAVASIRSAYPDCLAFKPAPRDPDRWKKVRIEFELRSSNFRLHGHDPKGCDLIVCWEHDWKDCPVKVMQLKTELERVRAKRDAA